MPKRQHIAVNAEDDENQLATSSSKRARTIENSDSENQHTHRPSQTQTRARREHAQAKGKRRAQDSEVDDEEEEDEDENENETGEKNKDEELDDEQFEDMYSEKLRVRLEKKRKTQGGVTTVADHGIIEYIEMHQFMCHKYLTFTFGPQINFIIGHNGSGKSAVLSAITVALGGKANSTGRGNGLKSFIREGQSVSEVTIHIKNQGEEAFKPKDYGKSIVITRRFTKEGSSSWKIKSKDGRVISTKKDELSAICDHMNIQVDNPMNVLTQDAARQFLSASSPGDKYKFFLRGTQLSQLSDEYELCLDNITTTARLLTVKKDALPDLRARFREQSLRYEEAAKAREQKQKADDLKKELAWSHVAAKEEEMTKKIEEAAKLGRRLPKIEENIHEAQAAFDAATSQIAEFDAKMNELESPDHLNERKTQLQNDMRTNRNKLSQYNSDIKQIDVSLRATKNQIEELSQQIAEESRRLAVHTQAKHEETQQRIEAAKEAVATFEGRVNSLQMEKKSIFGEAEAVEREGKDVDRKKIELQNRIQECDQMIQTAKQRENDALIPYGKDLKKVLENIKKMRWSGDEPLGPLGVHVKAKDPAKWGEILRSQLSSHLTAFAVTDARDRLQLKKLLYDSGNGNLLIVIYEKDMFDYRNGEPPENFLTVLRALDISDPYVLRILINQARIESQILAPTRREGQQMLMSIRSGSAWTLDKFSVRVFPEGGVSSSPLNIRDRGGATNLLLTGRDGASEIRHFNEEKIRLEAEWQNVNQHVNMMKTQYMELRKKIDRLSNDEKAAQMELRTAKTKLTNLQQEANDDLPAGLAGFEAAKGEAEAEKADLVAQATDVMTQKTELGEAQKALQHQLNEVKALISEFEEKRAAFAAQAETAAEARLNAQNEKQHYEKKRAEEKKQFEAMEATAKVLQEEFTNWTDKATEYCDRVPDPRKPDVVKRHLESVQKALKERERRHGASVEDMAKEVNKAKEQLDRAERELKQMSSLNKALKTSLLIRLSRWQEFRRHIALRCKHVFQMHLSNRGYYGKILFNHEHSTLTLRVQTDDQLQTQGTKDKDPRSLSGGEKSFSTICLLLSLWDSIGCPLRCLDEFDVFMDAVNRRISMKMMIETANTSDKKQYILITPQDMTNVQLGPTVRVLRMSDPERGNGMLPFASTS